MFFQILFKLLEILKYVVLIAFIIFLIFPLFPAFAIGLIIFAVVYFISLMYSSNKNKHTKKHW